MNCKLPLMEQMKADGLDVVSIDFNDTMTPESVKQTRPLLYRNGGDYYCVLGPDPQKGIFGRGPTAQQALTDFDQHFQELLEHPVYGDPVSDFIQHRHI